MDDGECEYERWLAGGFLLLFLHIISKSRAGFARSSKTPQKRSHGTSDTYACGGRASSTCAHRQSRAMSKAMRRVRPDLVPKLIEGTTLSKAIILQRMACSSM